MPKVSVIMTTPGDEGFLAKAVESLLAQTLEDFQLIIVDSSADTEAARSLSAIDDRRLMLLSDKTGRGPARCLNLALDKAAGDYVARMDPDGLSSPARLEKQAACLDAHPEAGLVGTAWQLICEDGGRLRDCRGLRQGAAVRPGGLGPRPSGSPELEAPVQVGAEAEGMSGPLAAVARGKT